MSSVQILLLGIKSPQGQLEAIHPCCQQCSSELPVARAPVLQGLRVLLVDCWLFEKTSNVSKAATAGLCISPGLGGFSLLTNTGLTVTLSHAELQTVSLSSTYQGNFVELAAAQLPSRLPHCCHISLKVANRSESDLRGQEST